MKNITQNRKRPNSALFDSGAFSTQLDDRLRRFVEYLQKSKRISPQQATIGLLQAGYYERIRRLQRQYLQGEATFRRMAKELGPEYRQLYALLEELNLPLA